MISPRDRALALLASAGAPASPAARLAAVARLFGVEPVVDPTTHVGHHPAFSPEQQIAALLGGTFENRRDELAKRYLDAREAANSRRRAIEARAEAAAAFGFGGRGAAEAAIAGAVKAGDLKANAAAAYINQLESAQSNIDWSRARASRRQETKGIL